MTDYTELVKALRCGEYKPECGSSDCPYWSGLGCMDGQLMEDAADAIEELQQIADHYEQTAKDYWKEACEYNAIVSAKDITAKESEELIRKFKKLPCGPIEPNEQKRGEWIGRQNHKKCSVCGKQAIYDVALYTDMKTPYCPHCGAKMEVQDGE